MIDWAAGAAAGAVCAGGVWTQASWLDEDVAAARVALVRTLAVYDGGHLGAVMETMCGHRRGNAVALSDGATAHIVALAGSMCDALDSIMFGAPTPVGTAGGIVVEAGNLLCGAAAVAASDAPLKKKRFRDSGACDGSRIVRAECM